MPLSYYERKALLPHGSARVVAAELNVEEALVSRVLSGKVTNRRDVQIALTKRMKSPDRKKITVSEAFGRQQR